MLLRGFASKMQNDSLGNKRYVIFLPSTLSQYAPYGVLSLKSVVAQGIVTIRMNGIDEDGYQIVNISQDHQGLMISVYTQNDISGYLIDCVFDFIID